MSYGQELLKEYFNLLGMRGYEENFRPDWLNGLEFDFYWKSKRVAIEFNGDQHYVNTSFGSPEMQHQRDVYKFQLCKKLNINLITIEAVDLEKSILISKFKRKFKLSKDLAKRNSNALLHLNKKCRLYRHTLITNFGSFTAYKRGSKAREDAKIKLDEKYKSL